MAEYGDGQQNGGNGKFLVNAFISSFVVDPFAVLCYEW